MMIENLSFLASYSIAFFYCHDCFDIGLLNCLFCHDYDIDNYFADHDYFVVRRTSHGKNKIISIEKDHFD